MSARTRLACLLIVCLAAACGKSPTTPSVPAPAPVSPANGAVLASGTQPITLTVTNSAATSGTVTYTFEVATDVAFTSVVFSKDAPQGSGQTSLTLSVLAAGRDYYWHARANSGNTAGTFSSATKFTISSGVTLGSPVPVSPATGTTADQKPTLIVSNVSRTGPVGNVSYRFEIASAPSFATILSSGTVPESNTGSTSFTSSTSLAADTTFFWRAQALDATNNATSSFSTTQTFTTVVSIDLTTVNYQRFVNISAWPVTNRIIEVDQDGGDGHMCINHEKRGQWPTSFFEDNPLVPVEATQWYFARINGQWYGGAGEWLRPNQICKEGQKSEDIGKDGTWGGPMDSWIPKRGELVGYMISTPARAWPTWRTIDQRSNVVVQPWKVNGITTP
ncbi:MAG: hypothetical protein ABI634_16855 [Acidobacteriota bacterium]